MRKRSKDSSTLTSKGQITLPKSVRERLGLRVGDRVRFRETGEGTVVVEPETADLMDLFGALVPPRRRHLTIDDMNTAIRRAGARKGTSA
ncbi:MAG TPA: AbrB/MazE/SpoVT family DNA-binding domain-containing protein [Anaeromyxobacter sp.]